ncbi:MAG: DNRLRE domain-containing protein [Caldilineaceae bacterium]|nr:DNRLRE domain-containing protein [Caldilineaceae bacterium]
MPSVKHFIYRGVQSLGLALPALLICLACVQAAPAAPTAVATITATADAYIDQAEPEANYGAADSLRVERETVSGDPRARAALVHFDLTTIPAGSVINRATLRIYQTGHVPGVRQQLDVYRLNAAWGEGRVTWESRPAVGPLAGSAIAPSADGVRVNVDVTVAVTAWLSGAANTPNAGLLVALPDQADGRTLFSSREGEFAPELVLDYTPPPVIDVPYDPASINLDGSCDEYADAARILYDGPGNINGAMLLRHSNKYLYICAAGFNGTLDERFFGLYLDTDNGREALAEEDDFALTVGVTTGELGGGVGSGEGGYKTGGLPGGFEAAAQAGNNDNVRFDSVEYRIPLPLFYTCGRPFGLALYQHWVDQQNDDYGWPNAQGNDRPRTWGQARLLDTDCAARNIQVCHLDGETCNPAPAATLYRIPSDGAPERLPLDNEGFVTAPDAVVDGDTLWAHLTVREEARSALRHTSAPAVVSTDVFSSSGILRLEADPARPLLLQDLDISAQWQVTGEPANATELAARISDASDFFYDYTAGQFMLGDITIYQNGERWAESDGRFYLSNITRPNSIVGGIVSTYTTDIDAGVAISYAPGSFAMGKEWNRFMAPPGQSVIQGGAPVDPLTLADDWAMAMAHELGHYLLFLFDTYVDAGGNESQTLGEQCYGSAMGQVYDVLNHSFVWDGGHWEADCMETLAYAETNGRSEWETINGWYPWSVAPMGVQPTAPEADLVPPLSLTRVTFIEPTEVPTQPLAADQLFDLLYVNDETASAEARAFTFRDDRIFDQGKPPAGLNQVALTDARIDDRLCVYDLNDHAEGAATPRYQFGCESIQAGDSALNLTLDEAWRPLVEVKQLDATRVAISVTQELLDPVASVRLQIYPEYLGAHPAATMARNGALHTYTADFGALGEQVTPFFVRIWVEDAVLLPWSNRETIADRGTGGGGLFGPAWHGGGVLVLSSDGHARFTPRGEYAILPGQSIAWQSMPGTPPLPADKRIVGQAYRLDAYPASLADDGTVAIEFESDGIVLARAAAAGNPALYFWDGNGWQELPTTVQALGGREDGMSLASAESAGAGVYAVLYEQPPQFTWLPLVRQP